MNAGDPEEGQLKSLQALERHLDEVEKKLERLIEVMQSATKAAQPKEGKAVKQKGPPPDEPLADSGTDDLAQPPPPASERSPFSPDPKPRRHPKDE